LWYDLRHDKSGDHGLTTDVWFAHSADHGGHWRQIHVGGPFNMRRTPHRRLGEYQGLAAAGRRGFAAISRKADLRPDMGSVMKFFAKLTPVHR
jgi:hypothetical protein